MPAKLLPEIVPAGAHVSGVHGSIKVHGLSSDSRLVEDGFVFAALHGVDADGASFVEDAIANGACAILASNGFDVSTTSVPVVLVDDARLGLAQMSKAFYDAQPDVAAAVTGTSGKTSVATFLRQIWDYEGFAAASVGTLGVTSPSQSVYGSLTTPAPVTLHRILYDLQREGVSHVVLEASSHGLDQKRLNGALLSVGAFTNLGRDHMDYHATVDAYFDAKMRLFTDVLPKGSQAVIDVDSDHGMKAAKVAEAAGHTVLRVGEEGDTIRLISHAPDGFKQRLELKFGDGAVRSLSFPLVGRFQISNALVAGAMALATGASADSVCAALERLTGASGRLEFVASSDKGALVFVDYAHKVEALDNVLRALQPYADGRLIVVFGAGGDRDVGKRPLMGDVARKLADVVIVTDDNPRSEEPAFIRAAILSKVPKGIEIGDREQAIAHALNLAEAGDVVLVAGKGHEVGQIVGAETLPFSDHEVISRLISKGEMV